MFIPYRNIPRAPIKVRILKIIWIQNFAAKMIKNALIMKKVAAM